MKRTYATTLFEEAPRASGRLILGWLVVYLLFLLISSHESAFRLAALRSAFESTAFSGVVGFDLFEAWAGLAIEVGLLLLAIGRMRPGSAGLRLGAIPGGLLATGGVWLMTELVLLLYGLAVSGGSAPEMVWDPVEGGAASRGPLSWTLGSGLLSAVVFQGFLLTQVYLRLGKRLGDRPVLRWAAAIGAVQLVMLVVLGAAHWETLALRPWKDPGGLLEPVLWPWLVGLLLGCLYAISGNLVFALGASTLVGFSVQTFLAVRPGLPSAQVPAAAVGVAFLVSLWLRRRLLRAPYVDLEQLGRLPLPRQLGDPVLAFRRSLGWSMALTPVLLIFGFTIPALGDRGLQLALMFPLFFFLWRALPNRRTNAFYLRAFRTDAGTANVRMAIQAALGGRYRLSGIRAPARRWPQWIRSLSRMVFCLHYSSVRYMNLEARQDWLARLWRSLAEARCALVDMRDVTAHVAAEIALTCRALGFERVLFLGDRSRSVAAWQDLVCEHLALAQLRAKPDQVQVALVAGPGHTETWALQRSVEDFARQHPPGEAGLNWDAFPVVRSSALTYGERSREWALEAGTFVIGLVPVMGLNIAVRAVLALPWSLGYLAALFVAALMVLFLIASVIQFIRECPTRGQATGFTAGFLGVLVTYSVIGAWALGVSAGDLLAFFDQPGLVLRVEASYPGADAKTLADTVAAPIEQQVNGMEGLTSIRSWSLADGTYVLDLELAPGFDPALARQLAGNRVELARPVLPEAVDRLGLVLREKPPPAIAFVTVSSPDGRHSALDLGNFARLSIKPRLARVPGVGDVSLFGAPESAWRIFIDYERLRRFDLKTAEIVSAIEQTGNDRIASPAGLAEIVVKTVAGQPVRLNDVTRIEEVIERPSTARFDGKPVVALAVSPTSAASPEDVLAAIRAELAQVGPGLPGDLRVDIGVDFTPNLTSPTAGTTPGFFLVDVTLPGQTSLERTVTVLAHCETILKQAEDVQDVLALTEQPFEIPRNRPCLLARLAPGLSAPDRVRLSKELRERLDRQMPEIQFVLRDLGGSGPFPTLEAPVHLAISDVGDHGERALYEVTNQVVQELGSCPALANVTSRLAAMTLDSLVQIKADATSARNVAGDDVVEALSLLMDNPTIGSLRITVGSSKDGGFQVVRDRGPWTIADREASKITRSAGGFPVPLAELVSVTQRVGSDFVERVDLYPTIEITANLAPRASLARARACVKETAAKTLPAGFRLSWLHE